MSFNSRESINQYYNELYLPYDEHSKVNTSWDCEIEELDKDMNKLLGKGKIKDYKKYVIGSGKSYGNWIQGEFTDDMEEADVVVLTGGEDISPRLYGEEVNERTHIYPKSNSELPHRDRFEVAEYKRALSLGKAIWGTCRGAQLLCAMAGGKLIQDVNHYSSHKLYFYDGEYTCVSNTLHHQMAYPYVLPKADYHILANTHGLSNYHLDGNGKPMVMPEKTEEGLIKEPEFIYYPKLKGLGIQGHPEMMREDSDMVQVCHAFLNLMIEGHLDQALALNLSVKDIISRAWDFKFTKEEDQLYKQISNKTERVTRAILV